MPSGWDNFSKLQTINATVKCPPPKAIDRKKKSALPILNKNKIQYKRNAGNCKNTEALLNCNLTPYASSISTGSVKKQDLGFIWISAVPKHLYRNGHIWGYLCKLSNTQSESLSENDIGMDFLRKFPCFIILTEMVIASLLSGISVPYFAQNQKLY